VDNTSINRTLIGPVVTLSALAIKSSAAVVLNVPERTTLGIQAPNVALSVEVLTVRVAVAVQSLQSPFTNEDLGIST
jgi:hypothetical protein